MAFWNRKIRKNDSGFIQIPVKRLIEWNEPNGDGCMVSDRITKDGFAVGYMYREEPSDGFPDSGWRFFAGDEDDEYVNNPENTHIFKINTVCNYDPSIMRYLHSEAGSAYIRVDQNRFEPDDGSKPIFIMMLL